MPQNRRNRARSPPSVNNPFGIQPLSPGQQLSRALHCDTLEHLKTPRSYRRLDSYVRQEFRARPALRTTSFNVIT